MAKPLDPKQLKGSLFRVWLSLFVSLGVYTLFVVVIEPPPEVDPARDANWVAVAVLAVIAIAVAAAIRPFRDKNFFRRVDTGELVPGSQDYLREVRITWAATWAMATMITIVGVIAYFFTFYLWVFLPFLAGSVAIFLIHRPPADVIDAHPGGATPS